MSLWRCEKSIEGARSSICVRLALETPRRLMSEKMGMRTIKAVATMAAIAGSLAAQQATVSLVYDTTFPEPFGYVGGIRVLSSGRILVADPMGQALIAIDMDENSADTLGRVGGGPQEYRQPDAVFPLPGDSTLLPDWNRA